MLTQHIPRSTDGGKSKWLQETGRRHACGRGRYSPLTFRLSSSSQPKLPYPEIQTRQTITRQINYVYNSRVFQDHFFQNKLKKSIFGNSPDRARACLGQSRINKTLIIPLSWNHPISFLDPDITHSRKSTLDVHVTAVSGTRKQLKFGAKLFRWKFGAKSVRKLC